MSDIIVGDDENEDQIDSNLEKDRRSKAKTALPGRRFYVVLSVLVIMGFMIVARRYKRPATLVCVR